MPVAEELRVKAKAFIDVFVQRFGKGAAAVLIILTLQFLNPNFVSVITLVLAVGWLLLTVRARREYVSAYREGLKSGVIQPDATIDINEATTDAFPISTRSNSFPFQLSGAGRCPGLAPIDKHGFCRR